MSCCKWKMAGFIIGEATLTMRRDFIESSCMVAGMALGCATRAIAGECCEERHILPQGSKMCLETEVSAVAGCWMQ